MTPAVLAQLDRMSTLVEKIYVHVDMDVLDPREVMAHPNKVPNGPSSEQFAQLFEAIFARYSKASAIGFATIPPQDSGGLSIAALNRMIVGAIRGSKPESARRRSGLACIISAQESGVPCDIVVPRRGTLPYRLGPAHSSGNDPCRLPLGCPGSSMRPSATILSVSWWTGSTRWTRPTAATSAT